MLPSSIRLVVCRGLVERMAGTMSARAPRGGGTAFHFTIPTPAAVSEFLFGRVALQGHVQRAALERAVAVQRSTGEDRPRLGQLLVRQGAMSRDGVQAVLRIQRDRLARPHPHQPVTLGNGLFGKMAREYGVVTRQQINHCVCIQAASSEPLRLGQVMVLQGQMSAGEVLKVLRMQQVTIACCACCARHYNVARIATPPQQLCPWCGQVLTTETTPGAVAVDGDL